MYDLRINDATLIDGTGAPAYSGDLAVQDGRIAAIGKVDGSAKQTIAAEGRVLSPGFIDIHTHYDAQVFWDSTLSPSCYHGVTTVFGGHCGFSIAPLSADAAPYLLTMLARVEGMPVNSLEAGVPWDWESFADYLSRLDGRMGVNAGFMAGHSAIRRVVMGERAIGHEATVDELEKMKALLAQCLTEGATGFSSTIAATHNDASGNPVPSRHASREELVALAGVVRGFEGTALEFLPAIGRFSDEVMELMTDLSLAAERPLNWNAISVGGDPSVIKNQLSASDHARARGADVRALTIPQPISIRINLHAGFVFDALEGWDYLFRMSVEERMRELANPERRAELDRMANSGGPFRGLARWGNMRIHETFSDATAEFRGRTVEEIARAQNKHTFDAMLDIALADGLRTSFMPPSAATEAAAWQARGKLWKDDRTVIGASDAGAHLDMIDTFAFSTQVLGNGVREHAAISLEAAVHQLTSEPARLYGVRERGELHAGWHADLVLFDPETVGSGPVHMRVDLPCDEPRIYADAHGVDHVFVNGAQIVADGEHTGALPGTVFRSGRDTETPVMKS